MGHFLSSDGTRAEYSPLQGWSNTKKYAFFAYYPIGNSAVTLVNTAGSEYKGGVPAIKYTMNPSDIKGSMVDLMTAPSHIDKFWKSSADGGNNIANGEINFSFSHLLAALELKIANLSAGAITLNSIVFTFDGIKYHEAVFSLTNGNTLATTDASSTKTEVSLTFAEGENSLAASKTTEFSDKLIFIPQTANLSIKVSINYTREKSGNNAAYTDTFTTQTPLQTTLTKGKKHLINIKFTDSMVVVKEDIEAGAWTDIPPVNSSFK